MTINPEQARALEARGVILKVATLYQTMGPHWKNIVWVASPITPKANRRCYVSPSHTHKQLRAMLNEMRPPGA